MLVYFFEDLEFFLKQHNFAQHYINTFLKFLKNNFFFEIDRSRKNNIDRLFDQEGWNQQQRKIH